jgi:drug/metabolite transporter (DMT)-like permease
MIAGYFLLKESMNKGEVFNILFSFSGTLFLIYFASKPTKEESGLEVSEFLYLTAIVSCLCATVCQSSIAIIVR